MHQQLERWINEGKDKVTVGDKGAVGAILERVIRKVTFDLHLKVSKE